MAIHRGIQSAVFYYLSCAPCAEGRARKKRKQELVRGRADREALYAELGPDVYRHPSPSSTNPHWETEISAGPALVKGGKRKNTQKTINASRKELKTSTTRRSDDSNIPSTVDLASLGSRDGRADSKLHFQQFQRDDEPWSSNVSIGPMASSSTLDGSIGGRIARPAQARLRSSREGSYGSDRNPMINDLHPATVTKVSSKEEAKFLMAPPPIADFMSGREPTSPRSRSDSGGSRLSSRSGIPLSREVSRRIIEQKMKSVEGPVAPNLSRESTLQTIPDTTEHQQDRAGMDEIDFAVEGTRNKRVLPVQAERSEDSSGSAETMLRNPRRIASRPQLSTIVSDSILPSEDRNSDKSEGLTGAAAKENVRHSDNSFPDREPADRRPAAIPNELTPRSRILKTHFVSSQDLATAGREKLKRDMRRPSHDSQMVGKERRESDAAGAEMFDSWYTPDFVLPEWIHEHTKREVSQRWSMDI